VARQVRLWRHACSGLCRGVIRSFSERFSEQFFNGTSARRSGHPLPFRSQQQGPRRPREQLEDYKKSRPCPRRRGLKLIVLSVLFAMCFWCLYPLKHWNYV